MRGSSSGHPLSQKLLGNVCWNFLGQGVLFLLAFAFTPFIVRSLSVELYGIYTLTGVVIGYFSFLDLGLGAAVVKYIAEYAAKGEEAKTGEVFWSCLVMYVGLGLIGVVSIGISSGFLVEHFFKIPPALKSMAVSALQIGSVGFFVSMLSGVTGGVIRAVGRFDIFNRITVLTGAAQIGLTLILLVLKFSILEIIIAAVVIQAFGALFYWRHAERLLPSLSRPAWDRKMVVSLFRFGGFLTISGVVAPVLSNIEKIFLTALKPVAYLTYYSIPFSLVDRLSAIRSSVASVLFPTFSYLQDSDKRHLNEELYDRSTLYIFFSYAFFIIFFVVFGGDFLLVWLGREFADRSAKILFILAAAGLVNALASPAIVALQGMGRPHLPAFFHLMETLFYIPGSYFLIARWGGTGAALAWFLRVALDALLLHCASSAMFGVSLGAWYVKLLKGASMPAAVGLFLCLGLKNLHLPFLSPLNLAGLFFAFAAYAAAVWKFGLDEFAKKKILDYLRSRSA